MNENDRWREIARGNVERHLGDIATDYESEEAAADAIYDEVLTLARDALIDAGAPADIVATIGQEIAMCYAQP